MGGGINRVPRQEYEEDIEYGSSPENVDKLGKTVLQIVDSLPSLASRDSQVSGAGEDQLIEVRTQ